MQSSGTFTLANYDIPIGTLATIVAIGTGHASLSGTSPSVAIALPSYYTGKLTAASYAVAVDNGIGKSASFGSLVTGLGNSDLSEGNASGVEYGTFPDLRSAKFGKLTLRGFGVGSSSGAVIVMW